MGTPEFAVPSLKALVENDYDVVAVITAPDKPAGRGMQLTESAVKKYALEKGLKILQPEKLKNSFFLEELKALNADLQVVVAFRMLPEVVWNMPRLGTINVHASLLPQYRGAAPVNWAIINGETETGVTIFKLQHEIDTGNILLQQKISIKENQTAGELYDVLKNAGAELLLTTIEQLISGTLKEKPQTFIHGELKHAPKIFTETCKIDWKKSGEEINNLVRGLTPYPCAFTFINNKKLKIYKSKFEKSEILSENGAFQTDNKTFLRFTCSNGYLYVVDLQIEGKKRMKIEDFLRGNKI